MRKQTLLKTRFALIISIFLSQAVALKGQPYYFRHYTVEKGLSNNSTNDVMQDRKGFIWIGTMDGLSRFDGYNFKIYRNVFGDSSSLGCNRIRTLHEGKDGKIWVGTEAGIYIFNPEDETFIGVKNTPLDYVNVIAEDEKGYVWIAINGKLFQYNTQYKTVQQVSTENIEDDIYALTVINDRLWIGTKNGKVGYFVPTNNNFVLYPVFSHSQPAPAFAVIKLLNIGNGCLLVGTTHQGVKKFDMATHRYTDIISRNAQNTTLFVWDFLEKDKDEYWIATESGIYSYNVNTQKITNINRNYHDPYSLSDNSVHALCKDREGGIWAATYFGGIDYMPRSNPLFYKYMPGFDGSTIQGNSIREITSDSNGNLWIGTEDAGLNKFNATTGQFTHFQPSKSRNSISYTNLQGLLYDNGKLWISTWLHGLDIMDLKTESVIHHFNAGNGPNDLKSNFVYHLCKTSRNEIWLGTSSGVYVYNRKKNNFTSIDCLKNGSYYGTLFEAADSTIWLGDYYGKISFYNPDKKIYGDLRLFRQSQDILSSKSLNYLTQSKDKLLWIATSDGLYSVDLTTKAVRSYSVANGLPSNLAYTVTEDLQNRLWITTSKGLAMMDQHHNIVRTFTHSDGLLSDQFNFSAYLAKDGNIYLGCIQGLVYFDPATIHTDSYQPPIYITNFSVFNSPLKVDAKNGPLYQSLSTADALTLTHNQSTFNIDFAALNYTSPSNIQYAYRLENFDDKWVYIKSNRSAYFTGIPPGEYIFRVRSTNNSGVWQANERVLKITILPPFWKTKTAYCIYVLLLLLVVYLVVREYKMRFLRKQKRKMEFYEIQKEKELYTAKTNFITKITHEIRTPLTLIKAPMEMVTSETKDMGDVQEYLAIMFKNTLRLQQLTDQLLDLRKIETEHFALSMAHINIKDLLSELYASFQTTWERKHMVVNTNIEEDIELIYADKEALTKIISNLLDNATKYGKHVIKTDIKRTKDNHAWMELIVSNDGKLVPIEYQEHIFESFFRLKETEKMPGTGIGLAMARSLAELHGGTLQYNHNNEMNNFVLRIPFSH
ncbi:MULTISPECIES: two-component regulator propeller domain-containing protein [Chitinophagaceae]